MIKLSPQRRKFADWYFKLGNAAESARRAGYSEATAANYGSQLLDNADVQAYLKTLDKILHENTNEMIASKEDILVFLTHTMRGVDFIETTDDGVDIMTPVNRRDRLRAAELLGKYYELFDNKSDNNPVSEITILIDDGSKK